MSLAQTRSIMVDDTSSSIKYIGSWFVDPAAHDTQGVFGSSLYGTLHGTQTNCSLSFSFSGNKVMVAGASRNTSAGATNPTWTCLIDGVPIGSQPFPGPINRWPLGENDNLSDGPHNITVNTVVGPDQIFWFDYIQYAPSWDVPLDNATVYIDSTDPEMQYEAGKWVPASSGMGTNQTGATVTLIFYGISLTWFGIIPLTTVALKSTTGSYSVDGQSPVSFPLDAISPNKSELKNQIFLQTPRLAPGQHKLDVTYLGDSASAPLTLDDVIVQNATLGATSPNGTSPNGADTDPHVTGNTEPRKAIINIGAIIGGTIGAVALVALSIGLCYYILSRRSRKNQKNTRFVMEQFDINAPRQSFLPVSYLIPSLGDTGPHSIQENPAAGVSNLAWMQQSPTSRFLPTDKHSQLNFRTRHTAHPSTRTQRSMAQSLLPPSYSTNSGVEMHDAGNM